MWSRYMIHFVLNIYIYKLDNYIHHYNNVKNLIKQ